MVVARTVDGDIGVMAGHAPLLAQLREGYAARIIEPDGNVLGVAVHGGFLSVTKDGVSILAEDAQLSDEIDVDEGPRRPTRTAKAQRRRLRRGRGRVPPGQGAAARDRQRHLIVTRDRVGDPGWTSCRWRRWFGLAILVVVVAVAICVIAVRRSVLARSGGDRRLLASDLAARRSAAGCSVRADSTDNELLLYRSFSPLPGAARTLHRGSLTLGERRAPVGTEPDLLPVDAVIVRCTDGGTPLELALSEEALTGLRSWLESLPPATRSVKLFHRGSSPSETSGRCRLRRRTAVGPVNARRSAGPRSPPGTHSTSPPGSPPWPG